uniref:NADH dehydrogenase subunit 4 n=1 Tax=Chrysopetalum debile TaxID=115833 RepID=UPI001EDF6234|nr:NADH dehydrogenase subunit 4 [Chrysopetalum debile]UJV31487.1 NADH dehydrogenase subunit 4 [Chrysopetalum debile]
MLKFSLMCASLLLLPIFSNFWYTSTISLIILTFMFTFNIYSSSANMWSQFEMFSLDSTSSTLILLTLWISFLMITASQKIKINNSDPKKFVTFILLLNLILVLTFSVSNLLLFYIMFEATLLPTLLLILGWGYQPERLQAGTYLMLYTITASLPLLIMIMYNSLTNFHLNMFYPILSTSTNYHVITLWWIASIMAFMVKIPLYSTHLWLPKAHVEAPVAGSMILAGILLKLGGYGIMRMVTIFNVTPSLVSPFFIALSLWGASITSMICLRQTDIKSLIAYSSVGHMGLMIAGALTNSTWGLNGTLLMMIAHGLCSSGMFAIANMMYEATGSRSMFITKGLLNLFPTMSMLWFILSCANMAAPPSINLLGEILLISSIMSYSLFSSLALALVSFLAAAYSLFLFTNTQHGEPSSFINPSSYSIPRNMSISLLHILPIFLMILASHLLLF